MNAIPLPYSPPSASPMGPYGIAVVAGRHGCPFGCRTASRRVFRAGRLAGSVLRVDAFVADDKPMHYRRDRAQHLQKPPAPAHCDQHTLSPHSLRVAKPRCR